LDVVPTGPIPVVANIESRRLRITEVAFVIAPAVHQIDSTDEGHIVHRSALVSDHNHLLVMAAATTNTVVEQDLTAPRVHGA
jgi:hypothetical protein